MLFYRSERIILVCLFLIQVFDKERTKIDNEKKASCTSVQDLRRNYRHYSGKTESYKKKLEASLVKDPPRPAEQDRWVCVCVCACVCKSMRLHVIRIKSSSVTVKVYT